MKHEKSPDPNMIHPIPGYDKEIYVKPTITNSNIIVGDFTYIADSDFESHVTHHYEWNGEGQLGHRRWQCLHDRRSRYALQNRKGLVSPV